jgi:hypothetical protein
MRTYVSCIALGVAVVAMAPVASAQTLVAQPYQAAQPYQSYIVQPSGTLMAPTPLVAVPAGVLQPAQLQTVEPVPVMRPIVHHRVVASRTTIHHVAVIDHSHPLYDTAVPAVPPPPAVVAPAVVAPVVVPVPGQVLNVSGQFQCIQGCAGGFPGLAFVTQNGWDLNLVNELGQPTRAWVDWPGHIWAQSWNEGAVYSPDGMTIQFDNGAVWQRSLQLLQPIPTYSR